MDRQYINSLKALEERNIKQHGMIDKSKIFSISNFLKKSQYVLLNCSRDRKYNKTIQRHVYINQSKQSWEKSLTRDLKNERIAVYTCIIDGYDSPIQPSFIHNNIDCFLYTNTNPE